VTLDLQFYDMMPDVVGLMNVTGLSTDGYGVKTYTSEIAVRARIEHVQDVVKLSSGREVRPAARIYMAPVSTNSTAVVVGPADQILLPAGYSPLVTSSSAYVVPILDVQRQNDDSSLMYWSVLI